MRHFPALLCTIGLLASGVNARAAVGWEVPLTVSAGRTAQHLSLGERADATAGIDGLYDVPALPGGAIKAAFALGGGRYWRDIRPLTAGRQRWELIVTAPHSIGEVTVAWGSFPRERGLRASLLDRTTGRTIDASTNHRYCFRSGEARTLVLDITRQGELP